jgi:hypothetical protein
MKPFQAVSSQRRTVNAGSGRIQSVRRKETFRIAFVTDKVKPSCSHRENEHAKWYKVWR